MALPYIPAARVAGNDNVRHVSDEALYWKRMQQLAVFQEPSNLTSVKFVPRKPYFVASTSSVRLSLFDTVVCEPMHMFSRFKQVVYGVTFRKDGNLIAIGGDEGKVRIFDVERASGPSKMPLRSVRASQGCCRVVHFSATGTTFYTMADDGVVKLYDLAGMGSKATLEFTAHGDAIRAGQVSSTNENIVLSGGYDHKIKLWDSRCAADGPSVEMNAGHPVENLLFLSNEHLVASAAGPIVKIWDLAAGGRQLSSMHSHHKTVTSLCLGNGGSSLLSGAIDRRINVFNVSDFSLVHSMSMAAPVFGIDVSGDDTSMAVAMGSLLALHRRAPARKETLSTDPTEKTAIVRKAPPKVITEEKGKPSKETKEVLAKSADSLRLPAVDKLLKGYSHAAAVNKMFTSTFAKPEDIVGWLRVIVHRRCIHAAVSGHDTHVQFNMLRFLYKFMFKNNNFEILRHVAEAFFDVYAEEEIDARVCTLLVRLKDAVGRELCVQKQLCQTIGALEFILNNCHQSDNMQSDEQTDDVFGEPVISVVPFNLKDETSESTVRPSAA